MSPRYCHMQGQWVRVHPNPKRYPAAQTTDWATRVIHLGADFCVVNKPARIPVQSHESNSLETVPRCLEEALGLEHLWVRLMFACSSVCRCSPGHVRPCSGRLHAWHSYFLMPCLIACMAFIHSDAMSALSVAESNVSSGKFLAAAGSACVDYVANAMEQ